jgi:hypothetical protein
MTDSRSHFPLATVVGLLAAVSVLGLVSVYEFPGRKGETSKSASNTKTNTNDSGNQRDAPSLANLEWLTQHFNEDYGRASELSAEPRFKEYHDELDDLLNDARTLNQYASARYRRALGKNRGVALFYSAVDSQTEATVNQVALVLGQVPQQAEAQMVKNTIDWQGRLEPEMREWRRVLIAYSADPASVSKYAEDSADLSRLLQKGSFKLIRSHALTIKEDALGGWIAVVHANLLIESSKFRLLSFYTDVYSKVPSNTR